eukprot:gene4046-4688_t
MGSRAIFKNPLTSTPLWHVIDASGHHVGKLACKISLLLRGKHKPIYDNSATRLCGDYVVVLNAHRIEFTGKKWDQKHAVMGMMPKNNNRFYLGERLKVYDGIHNPHLGQMAQIPSSSLTQNIGPYVEPTIEPTDQEINEYFAGYKVKVEDSEESFSLVETKIKSHKEKLKIERRLLRKKRVNELKPLRVDLSTLKSSGDLVD